MTDNLNLKIKNALIFIGDIASEELAYAKVGTGTEVALRHIHRKASEILAMMVVAND